MLRNKNVSGELDLFAALPRDTKAIPTANHILYGWLAAFVGAIVIHVVLLWQHNMLAAEDQIIKNKLASILNKINNVSSSDDTTNLGGKLVGVVKDGGFMRHVDVYEYFYSLAKIKNDRAWLTNITLNFEKPAIKIAGNALDSAAMYNMATAVKNSAAYAADKLGLQDVRKQDTGDKAGGYNFSLTNIKAASARRK